MENKPADRLSFQELRQTAALAAEMRDRLWPRLDELERNQLRDSVRGGIRAAYDAHDSKGIPTAIITLQTGIAFADMVDPDHNILVAIILNAMVRLGILDIADVRRDWGDDIASLIEGMRAVKKYSARNSATNQENFRGLVLALAHDIRVIIIMIVESLVLMRSINRHPDDNWVRNVAFEADCLYARLAHRLGLYKIKGELEDLALKYTNREIYTQIAHKLNETKRSRDAYIKAFIDPVKARLEEAGLNFEIKGRTKSISSIWNKMKKHQCEECGIILEYAQLVRLQDTKSTWHRVCIDCACDKYNYHEEGRKEL